MTASTLSDALPLAFGDICSGPCLYETHLDDSFALVDQLTNRQSDLPSRVFAGHDRGEGNQAVVRVERMKLGLVVTDSCAIATALGREARRPVGSIWFAPLMSADSPRGRTEYEGLSSPSTRHLGRWALAGEVWGGRDAVVELRFATPVRASWVRSILQAEGRQPNHVTGGNQVEDTSEIGFVVAHLPPEHCDELAARWAALSARRGPFATQVDANKFADLMSNAGLEQQGVSVADAVVKTVVASWRLEGVALARAGDAFDMDSCQSPEPHLESLRAHLNSVREAAQDALDAIDTTVDS